MYHNIHFWREIKDISSATSIVNVAAEVGVAT